MHEEQQRWCLDVMERLKKRPCAALFLNPVDEHEEGMSSYYIRIRNPMDLIQIEAKLLTNEYEDIEDWKDDVKLIWTNAERFHGKDSFVASLAAELRAHFLRIVDKEQSMMTLKSWTTDVKKISRKLEDMLSKAPDLVNRNSPTCIQLPTVPKMDTKTIQRLVDTTAELTSKEDAREMVKIVLKFEPGTQLLSKDVQMDVDAMKPITLRALEQYVQARFEELGKEFPDVK